MQGSSSCLSPNKNQSLPALSPQEAVWLTVNSSKGSGGTISISSLLKRREKVDCSAVPLECAFTLPVGAGCRPLCISSHLHLHKICGVDVWPQKEAGAGRPLSVGAPAPCPVPTASPWWHLNLVLTGCHLSFLTMAQAL